VDAKEIYQLADELRDDPERRRRLMRWVGDRTETEMYSIMGKSAAWYYMFRDYPIKDRGEKEFLRFLAAAAWRKSHYSHNAKYLAQVRDERDARRIKDARKSLQDRIADDLNEIEEYRKAGLTWEEIGRKLKSIHRQKYYKKKLGVETLRKYYKIAKLEADSEKTPSA